MRKLTFFAAAAMVMGAIGMTACGGNGKGEGKSEADGKKEIPAKDSTATSSLNIRYVDEEELLENYNLAKDFKEAAVRAYSKLESAGKSREAELQKLGTQIQTKMNNNSYRSEDEYMADMAAAQKKQTEAQNYLANLQRTTDAEIAQQQVQLMDSIRNYVKIYNADKHYDAILLKSAGLYFDESLDVTKEILEGLNARYNKK